MNEIRALAAAVPSVIDGLSLLVSHTLDASNRRCCSWLSLAFPPHLKCHKGGERGRRGVFLTSLRAPLFGGSLCRSLCYTPVAAGVVLPCSCILKLPCTLAQVTAGSQTTYAWVYLVIFTRKWCNRWLSTSNTTQMVSILFMPFIFPFFICLFSQAACLCSFVSWKLTEVFLWCFFYESHLPYPQLFKIKKRVIQKKRDNLCFNNSGNVIFLSASSVSLRGDNLEYLVCLDFFDFFFLFWTRATLPVNVLLDTGWR